MSTIKGQGPVYARGVLFQTTRHMSGHTAYVIHEIDRVLIFDDRGTLLIEKPWPAPGIKYVGSGKPRGRRAKTL